MAFIMSFIGFGKAKLDETSGACEEEGLLNDDTISRAKRWSSVATFNQPLLLFVNLLLLSINLFCWTISSRNFWPEVPEMAFVIPPLRNVLQYNVLKTDIGIGHRSGYGEDTNEADELWQNISHDGPFGWIKVARESLEQINQTSVPLSDGTGYLVGLEVFHEMHCLNYFRRKILGRSFGPLEDPMPAYHLAHCLDILRLSIECHADLSLMPVKWVEDYPFPWPVFQTTRQCRNWDSIVQWTQENSLSAAGRVIHPHMGPVTGQNIETSHLPHAGHIRYIPEEEWWN